ncbi:MAG: hypothetical protein IIB13_07290 [Chloroflexi bacterium]|nr:hypothetical protein [Chloroflexota bacterium]
MKIWIIITVLAVILTGGGVFLGMRVADLTTRVNELNLNYATLQESNNNLQSSYNAMDANYRTTLSNYDLLDANYKALESNLNSLNADFQSLATDYDTLELDYEVLEFDYKSLDNEYDKLSGEVSALKTESRKLEREKEDLQDLLNEYEKVPHGYYSNNIFKTYSNTYSDLGQFLNSEFKLPSSYELNVFDCSESAAYMEWALENAGFNAEIVVGPNPQDPAGVYHAWVIVYTTDNYKVAVEATNFNRDRNAYRSWGRIPGVVYSEDTLIKGSEAYYDGYDDSFGNIYEAIRDFGTNPEWNWWVGAFGFE